MLHQKIQDDQLDALRKQDANRLNTLRYIVAQIKNKEIDKHAPLTDEEVRQVLLKMKKELQESIDSFTQGKRNDLIKESEEQMSIVTSYLPTELSDEKLNEAIQRLIQVNTDMIKQNPKSIIGICMKELKSQADPNRIMNALKQARII